MCGPSFWKGLGALVLCGLAFLLLTTSPSAQEKTSDKEIPPRGKADPLPPLEIEPRGPFEEEIVSSVTAFALMRTTPGLSVSPGALWVTARCAAAGRVPDLTNIDIGLDPEKPIEFNIPRIEDIQVPGPVRPDDPIGIGGIGPEPPYTIPPPPGFGRDSGISGVIGQRGGIGLGGQFQDRGGFSGRSGATRKKLLVESGGNAESEAAIARGLDWLARHQAPDGRWSLNGFQKHYRPDPEQNPDRYVFDPKSTPGTNRENEVAGTAFGLLPFLAAGHTHMGKKGDTNKYTKTVLKGLEYLRRKQARDGSFGADSGSGFMYAHALATITLCEAYGMTSDPKLKPHAQAALNFIVAAQDPRTGGWRYRPRQGGDTSVTGWQVSALKSGQMAGLNVPNITLNLADRWLDSCEHEQGGRFGYTSPASPTYSMTAVGLLCRQYAGVPPRNPALLAGVKYLKETAPPSAKRNIYYEYYATQVMHHMGGEDWELWNKGTRDRKGMRDILIERQDQTPEPSLGSWDPKGDIHGPAGGRLMVTSLSLLTLEVYYRHLPLYQPAPPKPRE